VSALPIVGASAGDMHIVQVLTKRQYRPIALVDGRTKVERVLSEGSWGRMRGPMAYDRGWQR